VQRQEYKNLQKGKKSRLNERRIQLLNDIGFAWELQRGGRKRRLIATQGSDEEILEEETDEDDDVEPSEQDVPSQPEDTTEEPVATMSKTTAGVRDDAATRGAFGGGERGSPLASQVSPKRQRQIHPTDGENVDDDASGFLSQGLRGPSDVGAGVANQAVARPLLGPEAVQQPNSMPAAAASLPGSSFAFHHVSNASPNLNATPGSALAALSHLLQTQQQQQQQQPRQHSSTNRDQHNVAHARNILAEEVALQQARASLQSQQARGPFMSDGNRFQQLALLQQQQQQQQQLLQYHHQLQHLRQQQPPSAASLLELHQKLSVLTASSPSPTQPPMAAPPAPAQDNSVFHHLRLLREAGLLREAVSTTPVPLSTYAESLILLNNQLRRENSLPALPPYSDTTTFQQNAEPNNRDERKSNETESPPGSKPSVRDTR
jgi:hypothetical protein